MSIFPLSNPRIRYVLQGIVVLAMLIPLFVVGREAWAAHSTDLVCDQPTAIGQNIHCRLNVYRPPGDTGATHVNVGFVAEGSLTIVGQAPHPLIPHCRLSNGNHGSNCYNFVPEAPVPAPYNNLPYGVPIPMVYAVNTGNACGTTFHVATTVANVYNQNSAWVRFPVNLPACPQPQPQPQPQPTPQCRDGIDNDGDGAIDGNDFGCANGDDNDEANPKAACQDGADNDGDGLTDFPQDPGCASKQDNDEFNQVSSSSMMSTSSVSTSSSSMSSAARPQCSDGADNDGDGKVDYLDPGCYGNGFFDPNDNSEQDPVSSSSSMMSSSSSSSSAARPQCSDGIDNDGDGKVDYLDPGCYTNGQFDPNDNTEGTPASSSSSMMSASSSHACSTWWCGFGGGWNTNVNNSANTTVNSGINAAAQNNTQVWQQQQNNQPFDTWQNANVNPTANTSVNNAINAGSWNNTWAGWGW
jgi:hypothetical protein